jgi:hypothetical protein
MNLDLSRKLEGKQLLPIWAIAIGATCQWHLILRSRSPSKWMFKFKPYLFCDRRTQKILGRTAKDQHRCVNDLNISGLIRPVLPIWQNCLSCFGMWVQAVARSRSHGCGRGCRDLALPWMRTGVQGSRDAIALHLTRW